MGKLIDEFMKILSNGGEGVVKAPQKKVITLMAAIVAIGIILMFVNSLFGVKEVPKISNTPINKAHTGVSSETNSLAELEKKMSQDLEQNLNQISGVGKVNARVNLASSSEQIYAFNNNNTNETVEEKDTKGGSRTTTKVTKNGQLVMIKESQGTKENPVVVKEIKPEIQGVVVIAEGAIDDEIKAEITDAVQTLFDLPAHKVTVLPMESR